MVALQKGRLSGIRIGTMGWSYDFWDTNLYPKGISSQNYLLEYSKYFNTVEINNTFYRIPSQNTVKKWASQTPDNFVFSSKVPRDITQSKNISNNEKLDFFLKRISILGNKIGPLLLQFSSSFKIRRYEVFRDFIQNLPDEHRYAVEFRDASWKVGRVYNLLREHGISLVIVKDSMKNETNPVTSNFIYIRWTGDRNIVKGNLGRTEYDRMKDIKRWALKIDMLYEKCPEIFGYFSKYYSGYPPNDVYQIYNQLNELFKTLD
jgi:uncharacterized protein YecE (DUF72 family)